MLQVNASCHGCVAADGHHQLQRLVLLLLCHRLLWFVAEEIPRKRPGLSHPAGRTERLRTLVGSDPCSDRSAGCFQVQNGLAVYTTWTSVASLINFSLVLHLWNVNKSTAATASLCILFAEVAGW